MKPSILFVKELLVRLRFEKLLVQSKQEVP